MAQGLLSQANGAQSQKQQQTEQPAPNDQNAASPEEEQLMDQALAEVGNMIYQSDEASASVLEMLKTGEDFPLAAGMAVSQIVEVVDTKMDLPEDFILPLAEATVMMLIEMADTAGIVETNDDVIERSLMAAAKNLAQDYDIDPATLQSAAADPELAPEINRVGGMYAGQG
tara:strand:- start:594 stop:1106 length:513 start_codon:yes stop_codon:yes gene_type:complete